MPSAAHEFEIVEVPRPGAGHPVAEAAAKLILQSIPEIAEPTDQQIQDTIAAEMDNSHFVVAIDHEGEVIGTGGLYMKDIDGGEKAFIIDMAVAPHARRRGVGTKLMHVLEDKAVRQGAAEVLGQHHEGSLEFYSGLGYAPDTRPFMDGDILARSLD